MAIISRLKAAEISNGNVINADDLDAEYDQLISESNSQHNRITDIEDNPQTLGGLKTFTGGIATDTIAEHTAGSGVTVDGLLIKDGAISGHLTTSDIAAQSDQETATATDKLVTSGRQHFHPSATKAWVNFNGTGTIAIRTSYNVTSLTDNGTGDYTVNFTSSFSSADFAALGCAGADSTSDNNVFVYAKTRATGAVRVATRLTNNTAADMAYVGVVAYGDI